MIDTRRAAPAWAPAAVRLVFWDGAVAVGAVLLSQWVLAGSDPAAGFRPPDLLSYLLSGLGAASIGWARHRPLPALAVAATAATVLAFRDDHVDVLPFIVAAILFAVGSYQPRRPAVLGLALAAAMLSATAASRPADLGPAGVLQSFVIFGVCWLLGRLTRARREALLDRVAALEQQAATERALAAYELDRATLAGVEERLRIARELHDVLAHSISVISVQATVGEHLSASDPAAARQALATIGEVSRSSMAELRQLLTLLRDDSAATSADPGLSSGDLTASGPVGSTAVPYAPARGLDDVDELVATYRAAGLPVRTAIDGIAHPLSGSADLCAYRIVQEALTNTLKHAGPTEAELTLEYGPEALRISVRDGGAGLEPGRTGLVTGHGLIGMRERTALLGGELAAGPGPTGGFAVTAVIPYRQP
jgi:signal transduction histidine kinase